MNNTSLTLVPWTEGTTMEVFAAWETPDPFSMQEEECCMVTDKTYGQGLNM